METNTVYFLWVDVGELENINALHQLERKRALKQNKIRIEIRMRRI